MPAAIRGTRHPASLALALALVACSSGACRGCAAPQAPAGGGAATEGKAEARGPASASPGPLTAEALAPVIRERALPGELPDRIVVELAREAAPEGMVGKASPGTRLSVTPPLPGVAVWESASTLSWKPAAPFAHGTRYQVALEKVETRAGSLAAREGWSASFETPRFQLARVALDRLAGGKAEVAVVFSGPVSADAVAPFLAWELDGEPLEGVRLSGTERPNVVRAAFPLRRARPGASIRVVLRQGAPAAARGTTAPAGLGEVSLPSGPAVTIHGAFLREGASGFYVDVVCDDQGAGGRRYYWDREGHHSYQLSRRCVLAADEAARAIRTSPPVKLSLAPGAGGFRLFGDFARGPATLSIEAGARTEDGGVVHRTYQAAFSVPSRRPAVAFAASGRYLPRSAWKSLPVAHTNVDQAELTVRRIPPENLVFWLSDDLDERASERTSDLLLQKTLPLRGPPDRQATSWVDVAGLLPATTRGVLELTLQAEGQRASARLLLTQMSLVAKRATAPRQGWKQEVWAWALDIDTAEGLSGVELSLVRKSGKVLGRCTTSGDEGCRIPAARDDLDDSPPFALVARKGDDLTYVRWADLKSDTSDAEVSGEPYAAEAAYRAAVWTERGVYRPGEVAHAAAVLRDRDHGAPPAGMPVELQLLDPRGKVARKLLLKPNQAGLVTVDLPFAAFADTGRWQLVALVGDRRVGAHAFNVEEFVPERMKVLAAPDRPAYRLGEPAGVAVDARYLFGGSAEGASVELTCALEPASFRPAKENQQLTYGPRPSGRHPAKPLSLGSAQGTLDKKGHADLTCPPGPGAFAGPARLVASAAVFEGGSGRSTVEQASAPVHPERFYLGLQSSARRAEAGKPIAVKGLLVDWNGAVAPGAAREVAVEVVRLEPEYGWWWDEEGGGERFERHLRPVSEGTTRVAVTDGRFALEVVPRGSGAAWLVRARAGQALTELAIEGDGRGWTWSEGDRREQTPRPQKATSLALDLPGAVKVGEKASVQVALPFRGRALLTVETDRVISAEWRKVEPGVQTFPFTVRELTPNVYVSVLLVKDPHLESREAFLPDRAFGVASAAVEPTELTAPLQLTAPAEVRSSGPLTVQLEAGRTEGPTWALVAAVDEGILQLTRMKSPDPLAVLFARRALGVETFETIGWSMLLPPQGPTRTTGGDASGPAGRVQPVKPVALWSGLVPVSPDGKAEVRFQVPQYRGRLRVMAVTVGPRRVGRASASVTVKDPIVLSTTLPRFVTHGDLLQIPVFVTNLSGGPQEVKVTLRAEPLPVPGLAPAPAEAPPLVFLGKSEGSARLADGASGTLVFQVKAALAVGAARLQVVARAGPHESREQLDVPFLPAGPRQRVTRRIELAAAGPVDLAAHLEGWVPTSERTTVWLTANPYGESFDHLKFLLRYPYGCVEQTTSTTRPLLFVGNLVESVDPAFTAGGKREEMVMAGVQRLLSMQTPSGGLSYWPGGTEPYGWGTAYATHLLLDAQKAGFAVPQDRLDEVLRWAEAEVERGERERGAYRDGPAAEAYLHFVLALAGKGQKGRLQQLLDQLPPRRDGEALERKYMLEAALYLAGDRRYEKELRHPDAGPLSEERRNGWSFYSDRRRRGFMLSTFQDLFGSDPAGEALAQRVADGLRQPSGFYNTQEIVWGVTGLGKRVGAVARDFKPGRLLANGRAVESRPVADRSADRTWALARASEYRSLQLEVADRGQGGPLFAILSSEGVRQKPELRVGGSGLSVTRSWRRLDGTAVDLLGGDLPLAGLLFVEIALRNTGGERVENVALVDRIPAGFEIENPRLGRAQVASWVDADQLWAPDYLDVRDHQLALFGKLEAGETRKVVYAVRAVTAGQFTVPPVEAEAMYDPRIWARQPGGTARVAGPWKNDLL